MKHKTGENKIYLSIDHLKEGKYELFILQDDKVIKTFEIIKGDNTEIQ
ncbi:hypothetical protein J8L85_09360 [Maribacter sp. MMG018]|nr:hypothetical protein [Maribacter sp. MMG018]MBQ4914640.1 hypothetical protein [Maribacter sp. MMG018]